jgi:hypothetical protein
MDESLHNATNEELAKLCTEANPKRIVLYEFNGSARVVQITESVVVKIGATDKEARNQNIARTLLNPTIVYVPKVFRSFSLDGCRYLVMEYVQGRSSTELGINEAALRLLPALEHFATVEGQHAGPLSGGVPSGLLWDPLQDQPPSSTDEIETYFNRRLVSPIPNSENYGTLHLSKRNLILCHLDLAERNLLFLDNGSVAIFDWDSAGFYPQALEFCALVLNERYDDKLISNTVKFLRHSTMFYEQEVRLLVIAWGNNLRFW